MGWACASSGRDQRRTPSSSTAQAPCRYLPAVLRQSPTKDHGEILRATAVSADLIRCRLRLVLRALRVSGWFRLRSCIAGILDPFSRKLSSKELAGGCLSSTLNTHARETKASDGEESGRVLHGTRSRRRPENHVWQVLREGTSAPGQKKCTKTARAGLASSPSNVFILATTVLDGGRSAHETTSTPNPRPRRLQHG